MTVVQEQAIPEVLKGNDVFVKAKTGTGKTLGFLIPAIEVRRSNILCIHTVHTHMHIILDNSMHNKRRRRDIVYVCTYTVCI